MWKLPIPLYDEREPDHRRLAQLGGDCAAHIAVMELDTAINFVTLRRRVREELAGLQRSKPMKSSRTS